MKSIDHPGQGGTLQAYVDGELPAPESDAVRAHCAECASCARILDELVTVQERLRQAAPSEPLRAVWPAVQRGLVRHRSPWRDWGFALRTSALTMAGFLIGLYLGAGRSTGGEPDLFTSLGSTLPSSGASLSGQYLENLSSEGDATP